MHGGMVMAIKDFTARGRRFYKGKSFIVRDHEILRDPKVRGLFVPAYSTAAKRVTGSVARAASGPAWQIPERGSRDESWRL